MLSLPSRAGLVAQVVQILADGINNEQFQEKLPGELSLCESLHISRTTLRAALKILERRGYIESRRGYRRTILKAGDRQEIRPKPGGIVLLAGNSVHTYTRHTSELISQVLITLQAMGHRCKLVAHRRFSVGAPAHFLKQMSVSHPNHAWILFSCSKFTQTWFYRAGIPAFVMGHLHAEVELPAVDVDSESVGRHAAAQLLSRGHRRIALIVPAPRAAGDMSAESGFVTAVKQANVRGGRLVTVPVKWTRGDIERAMAALFFGASAPTALFVLHEETAVCIYSYLTRRGVRVPEDLSIIVGDGGQLLDTFSPDFTRYKMDIRAEIRRTCTHVDAFASGGAVHATSHLLMPRFHRGATVIRAT